MVTARTISNISTRTVESICHTYETTLILDTSQPRIDVAQKIRHFGSEAKSCSSALLALYVFEEASIHHIKMQSFFHDFKPSYTPSPFWQNYLSDLTKSSEIIQQLFPDDGVLSRKAQKRLNSLDSLKPRPALGLMLSIDKLFSDHVEVYPSSVSPSLGEILTCVIKATLKVSK